MAPLPSISYVSISIGFISFAFTFFTLIRVFWETIQSMIAAPDQMPDSLDNLRSELHGERGYFKHMLHRQRSSSRGGQYSKLRHTFREQGTLRLLNDSVKHLISKFKQLEEPFLDVSPYRLEKDMEQSTQGIRGDYAPMTLRRRWIWMRRKAEFKTMAILVSRIQTRRIALDVTNTLNTVHVMQAIIEDFDHRLWDIEERLMGERLSDGNVYVKRRIRDGD